MYLTYEEYRQYGGTLDETTFTDYCFEAEAQVNWYTFNRLKKMETVDENVKQCVYQLIKRIQSVNDFQTGGNNSNSASVTANIASQSNDGVSISYNVLNASDCVSMIKDDIKRIIRICLQDVKDSLGRSVLYRGIYPGE